MSACTDQWELWASNRPEPPGHVRFGVGGGVQLPALHHNFMAVRMAERREQCCIRYWQVRIEMD